MNTIETERLLLRGFEPGDMADLFEYGSQPEVFEAGGNPPLKSEQEAKLLLDKWTAEENRFAVVLRENGRVIGHICVKPDSEENRADTRELGFALNRRYHRRGIMTEAVSAVLHRLFETDVEFVWACCFQTNRASKGLIEKLGFRFMQEGTYTIEYLDKTVPSFEYAAEKAPWLAEHRG